MLRRGLAAVWLLHLVLFAETLASCSRATARHSTTHSCGGGQQQLGTPRRAASTAGQQTTSKPHVVCSGQPATSRQSGRIDQPQKQSAASSDAAAARVKVVHYPLVHTPVQVVCQQLNLAQLGQLLPCSVDLLRDLPPGMAVRGGVARNLLKALHGEPEPDYQHCAQIDVDVLALVPDGSPASASSTVRQLAKGLRLSGRRLGAGDVEVLQRSQLPSYFASRDITMNEVLLLATPQSNAVYMLCYSQQALHDVRLSIARPAVHSLAQAFHMAWDLTDGTPHIAFPLLRRCLVRLLKGHAASYALDEPTWRFYRQRKLQLQQLFQILRPFQRQGPEKVGMVVKHLVASGLLDERLLLAAGSVERLWQSALQAASASFGAVAVEQQRLIRAASDVDSIALWELWGQQQVAQQLQSYKDSCERTGWMPADESVASLGLLQLPQELLAWVMRGPTFNITSTHLN